MATLRATNVVVEIDTNGSNEEKIAHALAAIRNHAEVIYQATLSRGNLIGHADFLIRVGEPDDSGQYQYEVVDTKLARTSKAKFILQLCFYSDLLSDVTGKLPVHMHVELGNGKRDTFRVNDYFYYYRHLLERMLAFSGSYPDVEVPYPVPCDFCTLCHWRDRCNAKRVADDHLSAVANITRIQTSRLEAAGIKTVIQLALVSPDVVVPKLPAPSLVKLHEQAALQVEERETGKQRVVVLDQTDGELRGFARLPAPNPGDLFFDMEGDPMEAGGLEYLFGVYFFEQGKPVFKCFWAHNREEERQAFIDFMDFVADRQRRFPDMHIYHYANYEKHALQDLMRKHGVREADIDQMLREHRLVDLYKVVHEGLRISKPSYSIKFVESFYAEKREGNVQKATESIVVYERWRTSADPALLESIRAYNEDDCRSTWQLREWLLGLRPAGMPWLSISAADDAKKKPARTKSDKTIKLENDLADYYRRLVSHPENPALLKELAELIHQLLDFYRRADKPVWWALFDRQDAEYEELIDDPEVIAGLHDPVSIPGGDRYEHFRYQFPAQDFKGRAGATAKRLDTLKDVPLLAIDEDALTIDVGLLVGEIAGAPSVLSLSIGAPVPAAAMQKALFAFAESAVRGDGSHKAIWDYLSHRIPDIRGLSAGRSIIKASADPLPGIISAVENLNSSYLFIQGPPGSGKTYTGSHLIAALLQSGKRIAVSANSHKVIINLLEAVDKRIIEAGTSYAGIKKFSTAEQMIESEFIENAKDAKTIALARPQLVAGTAWLLAREEFRDDFDYLFLDEAGQISLASMVAMGMCAKNIVLLGDQMQLGQPTQGVHPGRSGDSALDYLLNGEATIAPDRGIFLEKTYRMHPDVCRFISDAIYDSRLQSDPSTFQQSIILDRNAHPALKPTGISYLPVEHDSCSQRSEEEAKVVSALVANLLTQSFRDKNGAVRCIELGDILVVAPYNMHVNLLKRTLPEGARVGTVDKFQGQEAEIVILSMATSSEAYLPRFIDFLFSKNRLNVALSRARCLSILVCCPALLSTTSNNIKDISLISTLLFAKSVAINEEKLHGH